MTSALPSYEELQLRLRPDDGGLYRVEALSADGARASGTFSLPVDETELDNFVLRVGQPRRKVRTYRSSQMEQAKQLGAKLFDSLVTGDVRDLYRSARTAAEGRDHGLRVTLYLTEVPNLMSVPWEFLFEKPSFLAQSIYTPLVRSLDLRHVRSPHQVTLPLRVVGIVSTPRGVAELQVESERQKLEEALAPLSASGLVTVEWLRRATLGELHEVMSRPDEVHVLHYIGHGAYDERTRSGILLLEDDEGLQHEVTGEDLGWLLQDERSLRLVVLNSCEGARASHIDPFSGVASALVQFGIPAVIGMQFEITDEAAVTFASSLYKAIVHGYPIDAALAQARKAIFAARNDVEFGTPVLFLRGTDARLFEFEGDSRPTTRGSLESEEGELRLDLAEGPAPGRPGEPVAWRLTIENTGGCRLDAVTARDGSGNQIATPVTLEVGRRHTIRWRESEWPSGRRLITVTACDPDGSLLSEQVVAAPAVAHAEVLEPDVAETGREAVAPHEAGSGAGSVPDGTDGLGADRGPDDASAGTDELTPGEWDMSGPRIVESPPSHTEREAAAGRAVGRRETDSPSPPGADPAPRGRRRWRRRAALALGLGAVLLGAGGATWAILGSDGLSNEEMVVPIRRTDADAPALWVVDSETGESRRLVGEDLPDGTRGTPHLPSISPDRRTVVFLTGRPRNERVWAVDADGENIRPFLDDSSRCGTGTRPAWNSDGSRVALVCTDGDGHRLMLLDGEGRWLRDLRSGNVDGPAWAERDGREVIVYEQSGDDGFSHLWSVDPGTGSSQQVTDGDAFDSHADFVDSDGSDGPRLLFLRGSKLHQDLGTVLVKPSLDVAEYGVPLKGLVDVGSPTWSPDGEHIAYLDTGGDGGLYVADANGQNSRPVDLRGPDGTTPDEPGTPAWGSR